MNGFELSRMMSSLWMQDVKNGAHVLPGKSNVRALAVTSTLRVHYVTVSVHVIAIQRSKVTGFSAVSWE